jgi:hypothetical protein
VLNGKGVSNLPGLIAFAHRMQRIITQVRLCLCLSPSPSPSTSLSLFRTRFLSLVSLSPPLSLSPSLSLSLSGLGSGVEGSELNGQGVANLPRLIAFARRTQRIITQVRLGRKQGP